MTSFPLAQDEPKILESVKLCYIWTWQGYDSPPDTGLLVKLVDSFIGASQPVKL